MNVKIICIIFTSMISLMTSAMTASSFTSIADIQGSTNKSPYAGEIVTVSAIVVGDFQNKDSDKLSNLGGFYIQQPLSKTDDTNSHGIFVFDGKYFKTDVKVGDRVEVTGKVKEHYGETQIILKSVIITGKGSIEPVEVNLPINGIINSTMKNSRGRDIANLERYEGMLVTFPQKLTVSNLYFLARFGEVELTQGGRSQTFTNNHLPNIKAYKAHLQSLAARSLILDDGMQSNNPSFYRHLNAGDTKNYSIRNGDSIAGATGILRYSRGSGASGTESFRLEPTMNLKFKSDNPRPAAPILKGAIRVASYNVLNYFSTLDKGQSTCGPLANIKCRGANSDQEQSRQLEKTVTALSMMNADIIGLTELENNDSDSIEMLVNALNLRHGTKQYGYVNTGTLLTDVIKTGFIYKLSTINKAGDFALLTSKIDPNYIDNKNRPALAQTFEVVKTGAKMTIILNHLKSKGSPCHSIGDPDTKDGQGNCNLTRTNAAKALIDWIKTDPTKSGDKDFLLMGDLNANIMEDPLMALKSGGLTNLMNSNGISYSYNFKNQAGAIDHALVTQDLLPQVKETVEWHINADEPMLLDYNLEYGRDAELFDPSLPYRASDHDPILIGLDLIH